MKSLILALALSLSTTAFAQMSGNYEVIKDDCNKFTFSQSKEAVVIANDSKFQVGFLSNYASPDGSMQLFAAFDFKVGTKKVSCLVDDCYSVTIGAFSADRKQFRELFFTGETHASEPVFNREVTFTLTGKTLKIVNGQKVCLLKKIN